VAVGAVLAGLETAVATREESLGIVGVVPKEGEGTTTPRSDERPQPIPGAPLGLQATPIARRVARELGVDLDRVAGSGPGGRITEADVRMQAARGAQEERVPMRGLRRRIAARMVQSAFTAPHVTAMEEADVSELVALRARMEAAAQAKGMRLTYLPFIIKAVVAALQANPYLNASLDAEAGVIILKRYYHIGIATATDDGLLVPVLRDADKKDLWEIAEGLKQLADASRARTIGREDLQGSTFTISNYGAFGGFFATPIINPPEAAILGVGRINDRAVVRDGEIVVRQLMGLSLSFDHRVVDGVDAGRFLQYVIDCLETPGVMEVGAEGGS
jgi:pyruvate dehydrogenase E2 component (dihydrolipoamide acetyltransferase)